MEGQKDKLRARMARLDAAIEVSDMNFAGYALHELEGDRTGDWSVKVTGNVRLTFRWDEAESEAYDVDVEDYH